MEPYNIAVHVRYSVYRKCPADDWIIGPRTIPDHEFVLITKGSGEVRIEGRTYAVKPHTLFYFYPGLLHSLESSPLNPMYFYAFHFSYALLKYQNDQWSVESCNAPLLILPVTQIMAHEKLEDIFHALNAYWLSKSSGYELMCNSLMMQAYHAILQDTADSSTNYSARLKVEQAIDFIAKNIDKQLSVKDVAYIAGLSPDYLSCLFKRFTGYPIKKYINKCRINAAKEELIGGHGKIKDIALRFGFKDEFYFSRVFKQFEGISPSQFCQS